MHPVLTQLSRDDRYEDLSRRGRYVIDLRYASTNNFVGRNLYGTFDRALLHVDAAVKLADADRALRARAPNLRFVIFDALRPRSVQRILWDVVVGTPHESFIANPDLGSIHNYGFAVDLGLIDEAGGEVDVGAGFDDFRPVAQPRFEADCLARGEIRADQLANRHVLRDVMVEAGFAQLPHEWWHFDALARSDVVARYPIIE